MTVTKAGVDELNSSIALVSPRVQEIKEVISASLAKKDLKGLSEISRVHSGDFTSLAGMRALKKMIDMGSLRHATTGKVRLYRGIFTKAETQKNFVRFLREAIADEYRNEWSDIIDPDEGFALVNPNQRAKHGVLLYSIPVLANRVTHRYLKYIIKKTGDVAKTGVHPIIVLPYNDKEHRTKLVPAGGFDVYGNLELHASIPLEAYEEMAALMLEAMKSVVMTLRDGKLNYSIYGPDQMVAVCKKTFVDPNVKVKGRCLIDIQKDYNLSHIPPVNLASRFNRVYQIFYKDLEQLCNVGRISKGAADALIDSSEVMKVCRGEIPYLLGFQVDVSVPHMYGGGAHSFYNRASVYGKLVPSQGPSAPATNSDAFKMVTGLDVARMMSSSNGNSRDMRDVYAVAVSAVDTTGVVPRGGRLGMKVSSEGLARELSTFLTVFRSLMRVNIWLNMK